MADTQAKVFLNVKMPGNKAFTLNVFRGIERLSSPFEYNLLMSVDSRDLNFDSVMGQSATASVSVGSEVRTYNGIIGHFEQEDTPFKPLELQTFYRAILYPKVWLLNFSGQCRIFQNKTTLDIITTVLDQNKIPYVNQVTSGGMQIREYCVQYNETDFNFISRLMEEEGIFYFFQQNQNDHKLVLADSPTAHVPCPNANSVGFHDAAADDKFMLKVSSCFIRQRIVPQSNTLKSYNYLTPKTDLKSSAQGSPKAGGGSITTYDEIFTKKSRGDELVKVKIQSEDLPQKMVEGKSTVPFFLAGYKFQLQNHPRQDANISYVLDEVIHEARLIPEGEREHLYKNTYRAFPATIPFKPAQKTHKPRIYGTQTAKVTGKPHEEIYTEEYGRIKVKFHWDPSEKNDDTTSCWIRVATPLAGQDWGISFTPRVGQEVVIAFIDGDPDKPMVVGSVYNGDHKPPYRPSEPTKSTIKSQTSKKGQEAIPGFNELRFEDKKESEEIYLHAQKDFVTYVQNDQTVTIVGGDRTVVLEAKEEKQEKRKKKTSNDSLTLNNGNKTLKIVQGNYTVTLSKGNIDFNVTGNISMKCTGNFNVDAGETVTITAGGAIIEKAGGRFSASAGGDAALSAVGGVQVTAGLDTAISAGGALQAEAIGAVSITGSLIKLFGALIKFN